MLSPEDTQLLQWFSQKNKNGPAPVGIPQLMPLPQSGSSPGLGSMLQSFGGMFDGKGQIQGPLQGGDQNAQRPMGSTPSWMTQVGNAIDPHAAAIRQQLEMQKQMPKFDLAKLAKLFGGM